jgi:hypothetical protein
MHRIRLTFVRFAVTPVIALAVSLMVAQPALAQSQPPAGPTAADDRPSAEIGVTLFTDYTVQQHPKILDSDGNAVTFNQFNVGRAYINVTGKISRAVAFRITPDVARETGTGSSLNGSYTFRLKFAYAQFNLDRWTRTRAWVRLGLQPTPWVDFINSVYRYRFQGGPLEEREGFMQSSDAGASFAYPLPGGYGDIHTGYYNGEAYGHTEFNDQKGFETRATVRPFPGRSFLQGLRVTGFYDHDAYVKHAERSRAVAAVTFEHRRLNAGFSVLNASDRSSVTLAAIHSRGYSLWGTPRTSKGWEGLLRYDQLEQTEGSGTKKRTVAGLAYWFPHQGTVSAAVMFDVDSVTYHDAQVPRPPERRIGVHTLVTF